MTHLSDSDVPELWRQGEDPEELDLGQGGFEELVIRGHRLVGDVVVAADTTQLRHLGRKGFRVCYDFGVKWLRLLEQNIRTCLLFLICFSFVKMRG